MQRYKQEKRLLKGFYGVNFNFPEDIKMSYTTKNSISIPKRLGLQHLNETLLYFIYRIE